MAAFDSGPCLVFPRQAQFHPLEYLSGLARAIERDGGRIFTGTHVASVAAGDGQDDGEEGGERARAHGGSSVG